MKIVKCAFLVFAALSVCCSATGGRNLYVSPAGSDANLGTRDKPFATLESAREKIRKLRKNRGIPSGGITVWLQGGLYAVNKTLEIGEADSGTKDSPIIYRGCEGEQVRIIGGRALKSRDFKPVEDQAVLNRIIDPNAHSKVLQCDLKALGIRDFGQKWPDKFTGLLKIPGLYCNGQMMRVARWPNHGWAHVEKVLGRGSRPRHNEKPDRPGKVRMKQQRVARWAASVEDGGVWLKGHWAYDGYLETLQAGKIEGREITFIKPHHYGVGYGHSGPRRYYAVNLIEELDDAGEYFLDTKRGLLYFIPPGPIKDCEILLARMTKPIIRASEACYVTIRGITFEATSGTAVQINGGHDNLVAGCTFHNIGGDYSVRLEDGKKNAVVGCDVYQVAGNGIYCRGGDRKTLMPGEHLVENCHIHHYGLLRNATGIELRGVGNVARNNLIHHGRHSVALGGNNHLAELNEFHNMCDGLDDGGAFYTWRGWANSGSVLRNNYFHDITGLNQPGKGHGVMGVYLDGASGFTITGNVFYKAGTRAALFSNSGGPNIFANNLFIDCYRGIQQKGIEKINDALIASINQQRKWLENIDYQQGPWKEQYPHLKSMFDDFLKNGMSPRGTIIENNVFIGCREDLVFQPFHRDPNEIHRVKAMIRMGDNVVMTKPQMSFVDAANQNWRIKDDSAVYEKVPGFKKIPFEKIGLYKDEYRKND